MKNFSLIGIMLIAAIGLQSCNKLTHKSLKAKNDIDSASYMFGVYYGYEIKKSRIPDINKDLFAQGLDEVFRNDSTITQREAAQYLNIYFGKLYEAMGKENMEKGRRFLDGNRNAPGVIETASGLQYKVIQEGTGKTPDDSCVVKCNYKGMLIDGKVFDSSYDRGQPAEFPIQNVIPGWTEGLQLMKEGGKYELFIPSDLAYGARGKAPDVGPNETLIFDIELLEVLPPQAPRFMNRPGMKSPAGNKPGSGKPAASKPVNTKPTKQVNPKPVVNKKGTTAPPPPTNQSKKDMKKGKQQ
jgi:FKBP-type peptidyl-prolyl cis-trans isomerase